MPVPVSSLSVAVQGIADFLDSHFGEEVTITVAHPQRASEIARGAGVTAHVLNIFAYRVAPSGFHADLGADQTQFIRINTLLTPFPADIDNAADDADMRILGHAIRALQSHPVLPIATEEPLPGAAITEPPDRKAYRLEGIMLAPPMEEINHIWTTQGGELAYRLSAVYEFALIPIEPLEPRVEAAPPETLIIDTLPNLARARAGFQDLGPDSHVAPVGDGVTPPPVNWTPVQMFVVEGTLINAISVPGTATEATVAVAGPAAGEAALQVIWRLGDDSESPQAVQIIPVGAPLLDNPDAQAVLTLAVPASAVTGTVRAQPAASGAPVPDSPFGNALTLTVT